MPIFSASFINSSLKAECAMEIIASALCQVDNPFKFTIPFSVATYCTHARVAVTAEPGVRVGRMRECNIPCLSVKVEEQVQNKD